MKEMDDMDCMDDSDDMEDWEERIYGVLGDDDEHCARNAMRWRAHLLSCLALPLRVTGREDFPWEEPYVFGVWDKREYARLKKTNPSYTDTFELLDIEEPEEHDELIARVQRVSDGKIFHLGLSWLRTENEDDPLYTKLNDYATWHVNY